MAPDAAALGWFRRLQAAQQGRRCEVFEAPRFRALESQMVIVAKPAYTGCAIAVTKSQLDPLQTYAIL